MKKEILSEAIGSISARHISYGADYPRKNYSWTLLIAACIAAMMLLSAFAWVRFTPMNGDDLALDAEYFGNGIVQITVRNASDKNLILEEKLKLMCWSTGEEVPALGGEVVFSETKIPAGETREICVDLSQMYDVSLLEQNNQESYYFLLTNYDFLFGHDWMCFVSFSEQKNVASEP